MKGGGRRHHGLAHDGRWQRTGRRNHGLARDGRWQCHGRPRHHGLSHDGRPTTDGLRTHLGHDRRRAGRGRSRPRRQEGERQATTHGGLVAEVRRAGRGRGRPRLRAGLELGPEEAWRRTGRRGAARRERERQATTTLEEGPRTHLRRRRQGTSPDPWRPQGRVLSTGDQRKKNERDRPERTRVLDGRIQCDLTKGYFGLFM